MIVSALLDVQLAEESKAAKIRQLKYWDSVKIAVSRDRPILEKFLRQIASNTTGHPDPESGLINCGQGHDIDKSL